MTRYLLPLLACLVLCPARAVDDDAFWALLEGGGRIVLMRHAQTDPGIGDPPGFALADCGTQRNLSAQGRADAARIGIQFRLRAIPVSDVLSSRWCRCLDTARLAFGTATPAAMLDSAFAQREAASGDGLRELFAFLGRRDQAGPRGNVLLVTHEVTILAMAGVSLAAGEMAVATLDGPRALKVLARSSPARQPIGEP